MKNKKLFILELALFLLFALIGPTLYLGIRFKLFESVQTISIWAIIVIAIFIGVLVVIIKYYLDGMKTRYSFLKKLLTGLIKIIFPLVFTLIAIIFIKSKLQWLADNMNMLIEAVSIIIASELVGIVVNPLPKWAFDNNVEGLVEISNKIFHREENKGEDAEKGE